jgi:glycosyltransferase involved in cell wall biosynthesis
MSALGRRLIFVTRHPPLPLDRGAPIRAYRLADGLSQSFETTIVTFSNGADVEAFGRVVPRAAVRLVEGGLRGPARPQRNIFHRASAEHGRLDVRALAAELRRLSAEEPGALFHYDDLGVALAGTDVPAAARVASTHNVEHRILRQLARSQPLHTRTILTMEALKVAAEERRVWRTFDLTLACSSVDASLISDAGARRVAQCPNGTDALERVPLPPLRNDAPLRLLFVGAGDFWPYELGLAWFVREVMPLLERAGPVHFDVVGHPPNEPVRHPAVTYHGPVADVAPHYERAHALVIPVFQGSGTRLKALEAAAIGRPVVSTTLGMEGLPMQPRVHYLQADDTRAFQRQIGWLRDAISHRSTEIDALLDAARAEAETMFWPAITDRLAQTYMQLLEERLGTGRAR